MMFRNAVLGAVAAALVAVAPMRVHAQQMSAVAVVDIPVVMQNSAAAKGVRTALDKEETGYKADFSKREGEFRNAYQQLQNDFAKLGPDAARDRRMSFEQRYADFEREVEFRKQDFQGRADRAMKKVEDALRSVLMDIAKEKKLNLILVKGAVLYYDSEMDLTQDALKRLDAKLPSVTIDKPAALPKAPGNPAAQAPKASPAPTGR
ncbi:MAG: OmpH family outer membrane protein [Gemmatimonas sp.]